MNNPHYIKKGQSDKIEINRHKIYRINDPIEFATIFFPNKNASHRRAAFLAIFFEIKNAERQKIETTDYIAEKYGLNPSTVIKARTKMVRLGIIAKYGCYWQFCSVFKNALEMMIQVVERFKSPVEKETQLIGEKMYIEMAKGENRKKKQETDEQFIFGDTKPLKPR